MKIAVIRGDFASPGELQNFEPLSKRNQVTLFTGKIPTAHLDDHSTITIRKLLSPVDLNFGQISRFKMGILNRLFTDAHLLFGLANEITGYDIAHCAETYYYYTHQAIEAKRKGLVKVVVSTIWENIAFNNEGIPGRRGLKEQAFQQVDKFLAVTNKSKEALEKEGCSPEKILVLKPGVDLKRFRPTKVSHFQKLRKNSNVKLLFVGRLEPEKGIMELVRYFERILQKNLRVELVIIGTGSLENEINSYISRHKLIGIHLLGKISYSDMPNAYSFCDVLVHPAFGSATWAEQYGMVLVEAMACGLPIVSVNKGSIPEVVTDRRMCVEEADFYNSLEEMIKDESFRKSMSRVSLNIAKKEYDAVKYAQRLENIYKEVLGYK